MATIHELKQEQTQLLDRLYWAIDEDDQAEIEWVLNRVSGTAKRKAEYLADVYAEAKMMAESRKQVMDLAKKRKETAEKAQERIRQYLIACMDLCGEKRISGGVCDVTHYQIDTLQLVDNFDLEQLPEDCIKVVPEYREAKKREILALLKQGAEFDGAMIVKTDVLKIV